MNDIWTMQLPALDTIIRAGVGYGFLLLAFRVLGRRQLGQLTNFDLVVVLVVANTLQNAMIGPDTSLTGGLVGAATVLILNALVAAAVFASGRVERFVDGDPVIIVEDGRLRRGPMRRELITEADVTASVRQAGVERLADVRLAILEPNGTISVFPRATAQSAPPRDTPS